MCGSTRRSATSPASRRTARSSGIDFEAFLQDPGTEQVHFIGKDIIYFHTLFWPAMLKFAGAPYKVPDNVYVHGFITVSGEKMSKSRGTGIDPLKYLELGMNAEWLRYYIAAKLNARVEDIDFNPDDFLQRVNSDLVGKYVNIASRAASFITKHFAGELKYADDGSLAGSARAAADQVAELLEAREYGKAIREVMTIADRINQDFDAAQPWLLAKDPAKRDQLQDVCSRALHGFKLLSVCLAPVLPRTASRVARELFGLDRDFTWGDADGLPQKIGPYAHLMTRVENKQLDALFEPPAPPVAEAPLPGGAAIGETITIDDFAQARPAHRQGDRLRLHRRLGQAVAIHARRRRGSAPERVLRHQVGLRRTEEAGRPAGGAGRQPRAAQDEVRRERGNDPVRKPRRREVAARDLPARRGCRRAAGHAREVARGIAARTAAAGDRSRVLRAATGAARYGVSTWP